MLKKARGERKVKQPEQSEEIQQNKKSKKPEIFTEKPDMSKQTTTKKSQSKAQNPVRSQKCVGLNIFKTPCPSNIISMQRETITTAKTQNSVMERVSLSMRKMSGQVGLVARIAAAH